MEKRSNYVLWFEECDIHSVPTVGGKNASLGELLKAGIPVPPGFAVTTSAYDRFIDECKIRQEILEILNKVHGDDDVVAGEKASRVIREMIEKTDLSQELEDYIGEFYRRLSERCHFPAVPAAVRSSATAEDLPEASFAGQQDTFLWIRGIDDIMGKVRECWSSLFTPRAITYRAKMGFPHEKVSISVGIQKMANSFTAGVMFTLNPRTGDRSTIAVDANWGFGESVVSGECTPDNFEINKITLEISKRMISNKECYYTVDPETHLVEKQSLPEERSANQCILDEDVIELAKIGKLIEKHYGKPMDIEWAIDKNLPAKGNVLILQARPETAWSHERTAKKAAKSPSAMQFLSSSIKSLK